VEENKGIWPEYFDVYEKQMQEDKKRLEKRNSKTDELVSITGHT